jgi:hypothetical protein
MGCTLHIDHARPSFHQHRRIPICFGDESFEVGDLRKVERGD